MPVGKNGGVTAVFPSLAVHPREQNDDRAFDGAAAVTRAQTG
jgi:hypothetical protein